MKRYALAASALLALLLVCFATAAQASAPVIVGIAARHVTESNAELTARIQPEGQLAEYAIWLEDPCPFPQECIRDVRVAHGELHGTSMRHIHVDLDEAEGSPNVEQGTTYDYWVTVESSAGTDEAQSDFTTRASVAPAVLDEHVAHVTSTDAVLHAQISTGMAETTWEMWLEDPCPLPQECIRDVRVGHGTLRAHARDPHVSVDLASAEGAPNIEPGTEYTYWVRAHNTHGAVEGEHKAFETRG
jgi:hypothetical protein